jgi:hypothetical protein
VAACRCGTAFYSRGGHRACLTSSPTVHPGQQLVGLLEATLAQPQAGEPLDCAVYVIAIDTAVRAASATSAEMRTARGPRTPVDRGRVLIRLDGCVVHDEPLAAPR